MDSLAPPGGTASVGGDRIFLRLLEEDAPFFSLKLVYHGEKLMTACLDGRPLPLPAEKAAAPLTNEKSDVK